jgi:hypothetical protein
MTQDASWAWPDPGQPVDENAEPLDAGVSNPEASPDALGPRPETLEQPEATDPALGYVDEFGDNAEPSHEHEERAEQEFGE